MSRVSRYSGSDRRGQPRASRTLGLCIVALLAVTGARRAVADEAAASVYRPDKPTPLSQILAEWPLRAHPATPGSAEPPYYLGTQWRVPHEAMRQEEERKELLQDLIAGDARWLRWPWKDRGPQVGGTPELRRQLAQSLVDLPVTGRVRLPEQDPRWLEVNPRFDPRVTPEQTVVVLPDPHTVAVIDGHGALCTAPFRSGVLASHYVTECRHSGAGKADWGWLIQPDGTVERVGLRSWNASVQSMPAPGARIWAPARKHGFDLAFSGRVAEYLATLGPSGDRETDDAFKERSTATDTPADVARSRRAVPQARDLPLSQNDAGLIGLLQTPSARMAAPGNVAFSFSNVWPYQRFNFTFQRSDWAEFGFRYTRICNRTFGGPASDPINFCFQDKSTVFKFRLMNETAYAPQLAVGLNDIAGTGLYSGEYLVASKRVGDFDFSLGIGWGYNGASGTLKNPLSYLSRRYADREYTTSGFFGNQFNYKGWFTGPAALFGGFQYHTPITGLVLKAEFDGNDYQHEPLGNVFEVKSFLGSKRPFNVGLNYQRDRLQFALGLERGNTAMFTITAHENLAKLNRWRYEKPDAIPVERRPVGRDEVLPVARNAPIPNSGDAIRQAAPVPEAVAAPPLAGTIRDVEQVSLWSVTALRQTGEEWWLDLGRAQGVYVSDRLQQVIAVLHRDAPAPITVFRIRLQNKGLKLVEYIVDRERWMRGETELLPTSIRENPVMLRDTVADWTGPSTLARDEPARADGFSPVGMDTGKVLYLNSPKRFDYGLGVGYQMISTGPNGFGPNVYSTNLDFNATEGLWNGAWLSTTVSHRLLNTLDKYLYLYSYSPAPNPGNIHHIRTYLREYWALSNPTTMHNLQFTQVKQIGDSHFVSLYAGYLEWMFAGVGGEYLYRPLDSRFAFGATVTRVKQRAFDQKFDFLKPSYATTTGLATVYWQPKDSLTLVKASVGRYLAGDNGGTLDISRGFANGMRVGAYFTKTSMKGAYFGEGSFDRGIYFSIPFDAFLVRHTNSVATFKYEPYYKDGGAILDRKYTLYDLTGVSSPTAPDVGLSR